jgi:multidrug efflux pump subunit AcrB
VRGPESGTASKRYLYTNSQLPSTDEINRLPLKTVGNASVLVADVGHAMDAQQIQTSIVRVDGQKSVIK